LPPILRRAIIKPTKRHPDSRYRHQNTEYRSRRRPVPLNRVEAATTIERVRGNRACDSLRRRNGTPKFTRIQRRERLPSLRSIPIGTIRSPASGKTNRTKQPMKFLLYRSEERMPTAKSILDTGTGTQNIALVAAPFPSIALRQRRRPRVLGAIARAIHYAVATAPRHPPEYSRECLPSPAIIPNRTIRSPASGKTNRIVQPMAFLLYRSEEKKPTANSQRAGRTRSPNTSRELRASEFFVNSVG
jgi:hypothetical protein